MSSIPPAVSQLIRAQSNAVQQQIGFAVLGKSLDAQKQAGDAAISLLEQAVSVQKQLANGHIDVRV